MVKLFHRQERMKKKKNGFSIHVQFFEKHTSSRTKDFEQKPPAIYRCHICSKFEEENNLKKICLKWKIVRKISCLGSLEYCRKNCISTEKYKWQNLHCVKVR